MSREVQPVARNLAKFTGPDFDRAREFVYPDVWENEPLPHGSRMRIGLRAGEVETLLDLCSALPGPFGMLYVLLVSRLDREEGRYQSPHPLEHGELATLLRKYRDFIERDGRHHVWVSDVSNAGQLIFDRHNLIYAYGPLDRFRTRLEARGVTEGQIRIPSPHGHEYHVEFDSEEERLLAHWEWLHFPLQPGDDE